MSKMTISKRYLLPAATALVLTACQSGFLAKLGVNDPTDMFEEVLPSGSGMAQQREKMVVNRVEFSKDYKTFSVWTGILGDLGPNPLTDTSAVRIEAEEYINGAKTSRREWPKLVKALNTESDHIKEQGVLLLVLVDQSLSDSDMALQQNAVKEMRTVVNQDNLYLSFMAGNQVTVSMLASDYLVNEYFQKKADNKYLYRSILNKIRIIQSGVSPWKEAKKVKLVVFSDGKVYDDDDQPYDPDHFRIEKELLSAFDQKQDFLSVYYINLAGGGDDDDDDDDTGNVLSAVCEKSGGLTLPHFEWTTLENAMLGPEIRSYESNRFDFVNPDGKVYRGDKRDLKIKFYKVADNNLLATVTGSIREGSLYQPIIVNGQSLRNVILEGLSVGLLIMIIIYLVFQLIIPHIRYRLFLKKYVVRHTGGKMALGDVAVAESCYYCKAPFVEGDEVVVKCEHTMHKHCWDENEYHCPEYGRHCKNGSHYYNHERYLDSRNAPYYLPWLLMAVLAGICAWVSFSLYAYQDTKHLLEYLLPQNPLTSANYAHLNQLPAYGFSMALFLTLGIALLAHRRRQWQDVLVIVGRALAAALLSAALYLLVSLACIALNMESAGYFINFIACGFSSYFILVMGTKGSRIQVNKVVMLIAVAVSLVSMLLWSMLYMEIGVDFRVLLLYSCLLYTITMSLAIASAAPRSERYFLHVEGAVKTMDVALYKWFRATPNALVTLGKSVSCSLQLSWDLNGNVAPVHAEISMNKGKLYLRALQEGMTFQGKPLDVDKHVTLHHGNRFQIGQTLFTFQEKDV